MRWLEGVIEARGMGLGKLWDIMDDRGAGVLWSMGSYGVRHHLVTEQ